MRHLIDNHKIVCFETYMKSIAYMKSMYDKLIDEDIYNMLHEFTTKFFKNMWHDGKLIMFGNGGSAADCDHIVAEYRNRFRYDRLPVNAISLADSVATITAIGNDFDYRSVFSRQLSGVFCQYDSIIALTTSGRSLNVIESLDDINKRIPNINSLIITGKMDRELDAFKYHIMIPVECNKYTVARIQEASMFLLHFMCGIFDDLCELYITRKHSLICEVDVSGSVH